MSHVEIISTKKKNKLIKGDLRMAKGIAGTSRMSENCDKS